MSDETPKNEVKPRHPFHDERGKFNGAPVPNCGRPKGSRHRATIMAQALIDGGAESIVNTMMELARGGDVSAARAILDRIVPPRKVAPVHIELPPIDSAESAKQAITVVIDAQANGELTSDEADGLLRSIRAWIDANAVSDLEAKVAELAERLG